MSLVINHNMMAMNAARNLGTSYNNLSTSVQRLSSGLRINSAADDAAGLAIREIMRSEISTLNQAAFELTKLEGIIPALESAHALGALPKIKFNPDELVDRKSVV